MPSEMATEMSMAYGSDMYMKATRAAKMAPTRKPVTAPRQEAPAGSHHMVFRGEVRQEAAAPAMKYATAQAPVHDTVMTYHTSRKVDRYTCGVKVVTLTVQSSQYARRDSDHRPQPTKSDGGSVALV